MKATYEGYHNDKFIYFITTSKPLDSVVIDLPVVKQIGKIELELASVYSFFLFKQYLYSLKVHLPLPNSRSEERNRLAVEILEQLT